MQIKNKFNDLSLLDLLMLSQVSFADDLNSKLLKENEPSLQADNSTAGEYNPVEEAMTYPPIDPYMKVGRLVHPNNDINPHDQLTMQLATLLQHPAIPDDLVEGLGPRMTNLPCTLLLDLAKTLNDQYIHTTLRYDKVPTHDEIESLRNPDYIKFLETPLDVSELSTLWKNTPLEFNDEFEKFRQNLKEQNNLRSLQKAFDIKITGELDDQTIEKIAGTIASLQLYENPQAEIDFMEMRYYKHYDQNNAQIVQAIGVGLDTIGMINDLLRRGLLDNYTGPNTDQIPEILSQAKTNAQTLRDLVLDSTPQPIHTLSQKLQF